MRIAMFTNRYRPEVGGVAQSVERFSRTLRRSGHRVLIVCPQAAERVEDDRWVVRVPALQALNGRDFSVPLGVSLEVSRRLEDFGPQVVHSHHPFLLGDAAARTAAYRGLPLVYTHHTMYEHYTHYISAGSKSTRDYAIQLALRYADLCDRVIAPSRELAGLLRQRGLAARVQVVPTGLDVGRYAQGDGAGFRRRHGIPPEAALIGHVGRLAPEKNLAFLTDAVARSLDRLDDAHFVVVGDGPSAAWMSGELSDRSLGARTHFTGFLTGQDLIDAYHAMDVFAFASKTETQGMVLTEALAAGCPVVALDAAGAREVVADGRNGRLVDTEDAETFAEAVCEVASLDAADRTALRRAARRRARRFDIQATARKLMAVYRDALSDGARPPKAAAGNAKDLFEAIRMEWELWSGRVGAVAETLMHPPDESDDDSPPA